MELELGNCPTVWIHVKSLREIETKSVALTASFVSAPGIAAGSPTNLEPRLDGDIRVPGCTFPLARPAHEAIDQEWNLETILPPPKLHVLREGNCWLSQVEPRQRHHSFIGMAKEKAAS
jgi:hypothetical protein